MSTNDQTGGTGPFLTKDEFHAYVIENRDRQDRNKDAIIAELRRVSTEWERDCDEGIGRLDKRVENLEKNNQMQKLWSGIIALITSGVAAVAGWFAIKGG